jgi:rhodanese-related sulfurtransferase
MSRAGRIILACSIISVMVGAVSAILMSKRRLPNDLGELKAKIRAKYPAVPQMQPAELAQKLVQPQDTPLLLDVRSEAEFKVSHLPNARRVEDADEALKLVEHENKQRPIVAYCSVGYRSSAAVKALREAGFINASNLEGSIFEWANQDRPLERDGAPANQVHPYDEEWGKFLKPERRAKLP